MAIAAIQGGSNFLAADFGAADGTVSAANQAVDAILSKPEPPPAGTTSIAVIDHYYEQLEAWQQANGMTEPTLKPGQAIDQIDCDTIVDPVKSLQCQSLEKIINDTEEGRQNAARDGASGGGFDFGKAWHDFWN